MAIKTPKKNRKEQAPKQAKPKRNAHTWRPGFCPNKNGRPRIQESQALMLAARKHSKRALQTIISLLDCENPSIQLRAAESLLVRGFGLPVQPVEEEANQPVQTRVFYVSPDIEKYGDPERQIETMDQAVNKQPPPDNVHEMEVTLDPLSPGQRPIRPHESQCTW